MSHLVSGSLDAVNYIVPIPPGNSIWTSTFQNAKQSRSSVHNDFTREGA